jgi:hypothetical protein
MTRLQETAFKLRDQLVDQVTATWGDREVNAMVTITSILFASMLSPFGDPGWELPAQANTADTLNQILSRQGLNWRLLPFIQDGQHKR